MLWLRRVLYRCRTRLVAVTAVHFHSFLPRTPHATARDSPFGSADLISEDVIYFDFSGALAYSFLIALIQSFGRVWTVSYHLFRSRSHVHVGLQFATHIFFTSLTV